MGKQGPPIQVKTGSPQIIVSGSGGAKVEAQPPFVVAEKK